MEIHYYCSIVRRSTGEDRHCSAHSDADSEEDGDEGDYTVYECPGLAPVSIYRNTKTSFH